VAHRAIYQRRGIELSIFPRKTALALSKLTTNHDRNSNTHVRSHRLFNHLPVARRRLGGAFLIFIIAKMFGK
jgi:hypothetical protein